MPTAPTTPSSPDPQFRALHRLEPKLADAVLRFLEGPLARIRCARPRRSVPSSKGSAAATSVSRIVSSFASMRARVPCTCCASPTARTSTAECDAASCALQALSIEARENQSVDHVEGRDGLGRDARVDDLLLRDDPAGAEQHARLDHARQLGVLQSWLVERADRGRAHHRFGSDAGDHGIRGVGRDEGVEIVRV